MDRGDAGERLRVLAPDFEHALEGVDGLLGVALLGEGNTKLVPEVDVSRLDLQR